MKPTFKQAVLPNGLNIIGEIYPDAHTAAVGFFTKAGTRDETRKNEGVSHFLEHMMFKGTERRTADDVNKDFDRIGANYNAYTNHENTVYYAQIMPEYLDDAIDLLSDMLRPSLRQEDFDMEKNVILEEIGMYDDVPFWVAYEALQEACYEGHPLGFRVLGPNPTIKALTRDEMQDYFDKHYGADTITVSLAGKFDWDHCVAEITKRCADWPSTGFDRDVEEPPFNAVELEKTDSKVNRHYIVGLLRGPSRQDDRRYAASVLSTMIGDDDGSRLYWNLIEPGLAEQAEFSVYPQDETGAFFTYASCDPARGEQVEEILLNTIKTAAENITDDELLRAKSKMAMGLTLADERPMGRMMALGSQWTYKKEYRTLDEIIEKVEAVTAEDIAALDEAFKFEEVAILRLSPEKQID